MKLSLASVASKLPLIGGRNSGKRVLVHEILSLQMIVTAIVGVLAVASLYWGGQWVLQENYSRWALQWTDELNELGAPLYLPGDDEVILRLESYVERYPEIKKVIYYQPDGNVLFAIDRHNSDLQPDHLAEPRRLQAAALVGTEEPYLLDSGFVDPRSFEILAPVWTESIIGDGLFAFDPSHMSETGEIELAGFVGLYLDFTMFHDNLLSNIKTAVIVLVVLLLASGFYGWRALRRALQSISDLQQPLDELAKGNLSVKFKPAEHREISEIVEALESTTSALSERDERLLKLANHDVLTGLFNRRRFVEELKLELGSLSGKRRPSALMFIDLDQFKYVNDTCGHPAGDRLIRKVSDQLRQTIGQRGLVSRFGGDEFAVLISDISRNDTKDLASQLLDDMRRLSHVEEDRVFHVHCSIGITMFDKPEYGHDELIAQADIACREAKAAGRNRMHFYSMSHSETARLSVDVGWMTRLREALDKDRFELRFQPIVSIASGRTTHFEVLLRLRAESGKLVGPDAFLPAAVRFGLMSEIDAWTIRHASMAYARHAKTVEDLRITVNLSANAFETEDLCGYVEGCFREFDVPPKRVIFEITESLAVRHLQHVEQQIAALRTLGCKLALDDFGTGYSSFSYLQKLEVDFIKIDGSFVRDLVQNRVDQKMVRMIAEIGQEAGMKTVAEYVQSAAAFSMLGELGVDYAQGYYIGRPAAKPIVRSMPIPIEARRRKVKQKSN